MMQSEWQLWKAETPEHLAHSFYRPKGPGELTRVKTLPRQPVVDEVGRDGVQDNGRWRLKAQSKADKRRWWSLPSVPITLEKLSHKHAPVWPVTTYQIQQHWIQRSS